MLDLEVVKELIKPYGETIGEEAMATIGAALLENDKTVEAVDDLKEKLQAEIDGRAEDARVWRERWNRFVWDGIKDDIEDTKEDVVEDIEEDIDPYDVLYGGD